MEFNVESPFSFDLGDELFPLPILSCTDNINIPLPQLPLISSSLDLNNNTNNISKKTKNNGRRKKPPAPASTSNDTGGDIESPNDQKKKKIIHRDVERQRRQEMSSLYSNLRSLIPLEYLKGKRSICDHMQEAAKYIRYMQTKIQQLSDKRDDLKNNLSDQNPSSAGLVETLNSSKKDSVLVRSTNEPGGVQVVLNTAIQHRLPVSTILEALVAHGLQILSFNSTKINHRLIHTIQAQVVVVHCHHNPSIDVVELQHKLTNLEYTPLD